MSRVSYTNSQPGWPHSHDRNLTLLLALRLVLMYRERVPSKEQLMADFGIHRATAYRWIATLREAYATHERTNGGTQK